MTNRSATKVAPPIIYKHSTILYHCEAIAKAINEHRIPKKSARKAMAKPQHSAALNLANFDSLLLFNLNVPTTAHRGNVRAVGITLTHALWTIDICKCNAHLKSVRGFGGLLRGIRGALRK